MALTDPFVLDTLASPFIDDDLFAARLGGTKQDPQAIRRYLNRPVPARPEIAWFFDSAYHLQRYPGYPPRDRRDPGLGRPIANGQSQFISICSVVAISTCCPYRPL